LEHSKFLVQVMVQDPFAISHTPVEQSEFDLH